MPDDPLREPIRVASARITLRNVELPKGLVLDEVTLEGGDILLTPPTGAGRQGAISSGEAPFKAVLTEPNLNRVLAANTPPNVPVKNLRAEIFSGYIRLSGQISMLISMPMTLEVVPKVENGVRISLDWRGMRVGISLPAPVRDAIEAYAGRPIDLSTIPIPIWVDEIKCEPGRLVARGKIRVIWPPEIAPSGRAIFAAPRPPVENLLPSGGPTDLEA